MATSPKNTQNTKRFIAIYLLFVIDEKLFISCFDYLTFSGELIRMDFLSVWCFVIRESATDGSGINKTLFLSLSAYAATRGIVSPALAFILFLLNS